MQNSASWVRLEGHQVWTAHFRSSHSISIGFRSGLWLGQCRVRIFFFLSLFLVVLLRVYYLVAWPIFSAQLQLHNWWHDIPFKKFLTGLRIHVIMWCHPGPEEGEQPDLHIPATMLHCWEKVLLVVCSVGFLPSMAVLIVTKHVHFGPLSKECASRKLWLHPGALWQSWDRQLGSWFFLATLPLIGEACTCIPICSNRSANL